MLLLGRLPAEDRRPSEGAAAPSPVRRWPAQSARRPAPRHNLRCRAASETRTRTGAGIRRGLGHGGVQRCGQLSQLWLLAFASPSEEPILHSSLSVDLSGENAVSHAAQTLVDHAAIATRPGDSWLRTPGSRAAGATGSAPAAAAGDCPRTWRTFSPRDVWGFPEEATAWSSGGPAEEKV